MISINNNYFHIETNQTSYIFSYTNSQLLLHHYYGKRIKIPDFNIISLKLEGGQGTAIEYENNRYQYIDHMDLEFSSIGVGDYRESIITLFSESTGFSGNFKYQGYEIIDKDLDHIPNSYDYDDILKVILFDEILNVRIELYYKVYEKSDVISRYIRLVNLSQNKYSLTRLFSTQIDFAESDYEMLTFEGAWAKERHKIEKTLVSGIYINDSKTGSSSNRHNPLVILRKSSTTENSGDCFGFNLIYSGNHKTTVEVTPFKKMRLLQGINDHAFNFLISPQGEFITPESIMTYSNNGMNLLSQNFHSFINSHLIRGIYKNKERPILINSWEASYFNFNEKKLLELAKKAKDVGIELFVLDDGWFGKRNNDKTSLGDWNVNYTKLPDGLEGLAKKINQIGLDFGLWVEPEMISEDSDLYRKHPDWAVVLKGRIPSIGRNQLVLDLTNPEVVSFLIEKLSEIFSCCNLKYVKWDYNRNITELYSNALDNQGEFFHRYIMGFYKLIDELTKRFPNILFEGCASGGNRFDLGMLAYFVQIWTSDDTDYLERIYIQTGTSYGYPLSVIANHVSDVPNHQTLRITPITSRFNIACFGVLGYELNLNELSDEEILEVKRQIKLYKKYRLLFQYGKFYRSEKSIFNHNRNYLYIVDEKQELSILGFFQSLVHPAMDEDIIRHYGLKDQLYTFKNFSQKLNLKMFGGLINFVFPVRIKINGKIHNLLSKLYHPPQEKDYYLITGETFKYAGVRLNQQFMGTGFGEKVRVLGDFGSRLYLIKKHHEAYKLSRKKIKS